LSGTAPARASRPKERTASARRYGHEQRRVPHRQDHLAWLRALADGGTLLLAGATREPADTGVLVVRAADVHEVRRLLLDDPYAAANLISGVVVRPLGLAVGG
jgi:uncharacterized protein